MSRWIWIAAACAPACAFIGAAHARPRPKIARFDVTLTATLQANWERPTTFVEDGCTFEGTEASWRSVTFATTRPVRIRIARAGDGVRFVSSRIGSLAGFDIQPGAPHVEATSQNCGRTVSRTPVDAIGVRRGVAAVRIVRPRRGALVLSAPAFPRIFRDPWVPPDFGSVAPRLDVAVGRLAERRLLDPHAKRTTVSAERSGIARVIGDAPGQVTLDVKWTLRFTRLR